jgi:hypothetical protein
VEVLTTRVQTSGFYVAVKEACPSTAVALWLVDHTTGEAALRDDERHAPRAVP